MSSNWFSESQAQRLSADILTHRCTSTCALRHIPYPARLTYASLKMSSRLDATVTWATAPVSPSFGQPLSGAVRGCACIPICVCRNYISLKCAPMHPFFVKYVCCVYSLAEKWWLNVCGSGLSRTNKELLWLWQSDGQMRRLWSNHVTPDLLSAVESAFSEGQQVNVWSFVDVTPVFTKEFLQSVS